MEIKSIKNIDYEKKYSIEEMNKIIDLIRKKKDLLVNKYTICSEVAESQYLLDNIEVSLHMHTAMFKYFWSEDNYDATNYLEEIGIDTEKGYLTDDEASLAAKKLGYYD